MDNIHEDDNLANRTEVKDNKLHVEKKDVVKKVTRKHKPVDHEREDILRNARKKAHDPVADAKRKFLMKLELIVYYKKLTITGICSSLM